MQVSAQPTSGDASAGLAIYQSRGCAGCHGTPAGTLTPAIRNAAHAGGIVGLATVRGMGGYNAGSFTLAQENDLAAYIGSVLPGSPQQAVGYDAAATFTLSDIFLGTAFGAFSSIQLTTPPTKSVVTFSGRDATVFAQPSQCGSDQFSWQAVGSFGGSSYASNVRTTSLMIANPSPPDFSGVSMAVTGGFGNAFEFRAAAVGALSYSHVGALPPGLHLDGSNGRISGMPTARGVYVVTITASNCANGNPSGQSTSHTLTITIGQGTQSLLFPPLNNILTTDAPFDVNVLGGASGNPVTIEASGVCTAGGTGGRTISLTGAAGTCTLTAQQAGNADYLPAEPVARSFMVVANGNEVFPPDCVMPPGWSVQSGFDPWVAVTEAGGASEGICALAVMRGWRFPPDITPSARLVFSGQFDAGHVVFSRRVDSQPDFECLRFTIDGVDQPIAGSCVFSTGASGVLPYARVSIPITAGHHTLVWDMQPFGFGISFSRAWIDHVSLPLSTTITSASTRALPFGQSFSHAITATNFPAQLTVEGLPSGVTFDAATATIAGMPSSAGTYPLQITASNPGGANPQASTTQAFTLIVTKLAQTLLFAPLADRPIGSSPFELAATGGASGNPVTYAATGACNVSGTTVTLGALAGTCTLTARQAGNESYEDASPVTRSFAVTAVVPGAPRLESATPANTRITLSFLPPLSNGGSAIVLYTATCGAVTATGTASPITVSGLANNVAVMCRVVARNGIGDGASSNSLSASPTALAFTGRVYSRLPHGAAGQWVDAELDAVISGLPAGTETRLPQGGFAIHFQMSANVGNVGVLNVTDASGLPIQGAHAYASGHDIIVKLPAITGRASIALSGIDGAVAAAAIIDFDLADVNVSRRVTAADIAAVKARAGLSESASLARFDVNRDGIIDAKDAQVTKSRSGHPNPNP
jgi:hypothetical protein